MQHKCIYKYLYTVPRNLKSIFVYLLVSLSIVSVAQVPETNPTINAANLWIFGKNIWLDFANNNIIQKRTNEINVLEGTTSYRDSLNSFYLTGNGNEGSKLRINDYSIATYFDGNGTQSVLFIVHQETKQLWVLNSSRGGGCGYSYLLSDSTETEFNRFPFNGGEKQQAVNHQNGRDIWYANHAREGDSVYFFLLKKQGLLECPVVTHTTNGYYGGENGWSTQGQMKFSSDGKYLAEATYVDPFSIGLYAFNNEYPSTDKIYLHSKGFVAPYTKRWFSGLEFSLDNSKLYVNTGKKTNNPQEPDPVVLYQLNLAELHQDSIEQSWFPLDSMFGLDQGNLQLASNGKLYIAMPNLTYLGVINNPNQLGTNCNYVRQGLTLDSGGISQYGLPTFNQSYFYTPAIDFKYEEDCSTNAYQFWGLDTFQGTSFEWKFRDSRNETVDVRQGKNVSYSFPQADSLENKYEVTFIASGGSTTDSVTKTLTIRPKLTNDFLGRDTFYCEDTSIELILHTPADMHCIHWDGLEPYSNLMGDTIIGYENFYGHINANTFRTIDTAGVYLARITNKTFCTAWDTLRVTEKPRPSKSVISRNGNALKSSISASAYRWYFNGEIDTLTFQPFYEPTANGYWQVQLISEFGCESELSDSFLVYFASIKPLNPKPLSFKIYPNPSNGNISIEVPKSGEYRIQVTDLNGKLIYSTTQNLSPRMRLFAAANITAGTYIITLTDENGNTGSEKIEVVR